MLQTLAVLINNFCQEWIRAYRKNMQTDMGMYMDMDMNRNTGRDMDTDMDTLTRMWTISSDTNSLLKSLVPNKWCYRVFGT